jgi:hypothetical protein
MVLYGSKHLIANYRGPEFYGLQNSMTYILRGKEHTSTLGLFSADVKDKDDGQVIMRITVPKQVLHLDRVQYGLLNDVTPIRLGSV